VTPEKLDALANYRAAAQATAACRQKLLLALAYGDPLLAYDAAVGEAMNALLHALALGIPLADLARVTRQVRQTPEPAVEHLPEGGTLWW
jgi:hypothetical protein